MRKCCPPPFRPGGLSFHRGWSVGCRAAIHKPICLDLSLSQLKQGSTGLWVPLPPPEAVAVGSSLTVPLVAAVVVVQNATVLDLKKAIQRYVQLKQEREGGIQHISW